MIQGNLTKLDNDFITIWSHYVLYREIDKDALRKLAELGQINAVQSYYLFIKETNAKVDGIVKEYRGLNPDEIFAQANKEYFYGSKDIEKANQLLEEIADKQDEYNKIREKYYNTSYYNTSNYYDEIEQLEMMMNVKASERRALEEQFYAIPFIDHKRNSIREYWNIGIQTGNPLFNERAVEIQKRMPLADLDDLRKCVKTTRKGLMKRYKKDKEDVAVKFGLAKNLVLFQASNKEKEIAKTILKQLASRELSQELQAYDENHCQDISFLGEDDEILPEFDD